MTQFLEEITNETELIMNYSLRGVS